MTKAKAVKTPGVASNQTAEPKNLVKFRISGIKGNQTATANIEAENQEKAEAAFRKKYPDYKIHLAQKA